MPNIELINKVINVIKEEENFFSMSDFFVSEAMRGSDDLPEEVYEVKCGTPACICGWVQKIVDPKLKGSELGDTTAAAKALGLTYNDSDNLFYALHAGKPWSEITRHEAVKVLEHLRDTGKVDWSIIQEDSVEDALADGRTTL